MQERKQEGIVTLTSVIIRVAFLGVFVLSAVILVLNGTSVRNKWGINVRRPSCSRCKTPAPGARIPKSLRQLLWGGWTCQSCGAQVDKWGNEIASEKKSSVRDGAGHS